MNIFNWIQSRRSQTASPPPSRDRRVGMLLAWLGVVFILGCAGGDFGCNKANTKTTHPNGLQIASATGPWNTPDWTFGETAQMPVAVLLLPGETAGEDVVVTPFAPPGCTVKPAQRTVKLPALGGATYVTFDVAITNSTDAERTLFGANRTTAAEGIDAISTYADAPFNVVEDLVSVTITPGSVSLPTHKPQIFTLSILPRGNTEGVVQLFPGVSAGDGEAYIVNPEHIDVTMVKGSTTPVIKEVTVNPFLIDEGTTFEVKIDAHTVVGKAQITYGIGDGTPSFDFTASKSEVTVENGASSEDVLFVINSKNGFNGKVKVSWVVDGPVSPQPNDQDVEMNVSPGHSAQFVRKFYRYATHSVEIPVTFNVTDVPFTMQKSVTIHVKHP